MSFYSFGEKNNLKLIIAIAKTFLTTGRLMETSIYKGRNDSGKLYISCEFKGEIPDEDLQAIMSKVEVKIDPNEQIVKIKGLK